MSNPYSPVTVSGYNASPPDDDGSEINSNQIEWEKHTDKIGDPLNTAIAAMDTNIAAAFGLIFGTTISSHSGNYTILTTDRGRFFEATATLTFTLPPVASAGVGFPLAFFNNNSGIMTLDGNGANINGSANLAVGSAGGAIVTTDGSEWLAIPIIGQVFTNYAITHQDVSSAAGVLTIDLALGNSVCCVLTENITSIVITNFVASGTRSEFEIIFDQDPSTAYTVAWAAKYQFPNGNDHVMSTTLGARDIVQGFTVDGDTTWDCNFSKGSA